MRNCELTEQPREKLVRSSLNSSSSKQMWTFPKKKRFVKVKPQCPHSSYQTQLTNLNPHYPKFSNTPRVIFPDRDHFPSPADYKPQRKTTKNGKTFGESRSKCPSGSYIFADLLRNPAPTDYQKFAADNIHRSKKGFSLRPRTAHNYNYLNNLYFIDDKERKQFPCPLKYNITNEKDGKYKIAKFRSVNMTGGAGMMNRSLRFHTSYSSPGPSCYEPKKLSQRSSFHCPMNKTMRSSWIDRISHKESSPGPGDYKLPSEFGYYVKPKRRRFRTIE